MNRTSRTRAMARSVILALGLIAGLLVASPAEAGWRNKGVISAEVLSSAAEYVSGGDVRIGVDVPRGTGTHSIRVYVNGSRVRADMEHVGRRRLEGVVSGLPDGPSTIEVRARASRWRSGAQPAVLEVVNYPNSGPMFTGPHQEPFYCQTEAAGLGPALDADCFAETKVEFLYASTDGTFKDVPEELIGNHRPWRHWWAHQPAMPDDMRETTTSEGKTVDYIVRRETGVINRAVYQTAVLYNPRVHDTDSKHATPGWNGRLVYSYGGGCNAAYAQGAGNGGIMTEAHLALGYATASSSLNVLNNNCNDVLSAETTSMVKEHFIETYGADVHTIGWGGSGGAISQFTIAHNYPGLLDGIIPTLMYPDATSIFSGIGDCKLAFEYFGTATPGLWDAAGQTEISGYDDWTNCLSWVFSFSNRIDATSGCNSIVPADTIYNPVTNPGGVRCSVADDSVNVLGIDPDTGFAPTPASNVGVQYGLTSFNDGDLSFEQFVDINANIGGFDSDGVAIDERTGPSSVVNRFYETGRITTGEGLATIPIINVRPYTDAVSDIHTRYYTYAMRERLLRDNGTAENQIVQIYGLGTPPEVQAGVAAQALADMDEWLTNITSDTLDRTAAEVIAAKPSQTVDTCWDAAGTAIIEPASYDGDTACNALYPTFADPRVETGAPLTGDVLACQLRPFDPADYTVVLTDAQVDTLASVFADGVCDYSVPGIGQGTWAGPWQSYAS